MTTKKIVEGSNDIKRSVGDLRKLLITRPGLDKIRFKRYGRKYIITNKNTDISDMLKQSFDSFIHKLNVKEDGKELKGICFLGDGNAGDFNIYYQTGQEKTIHQIKGKLGSK